MSAALVPVRKNPAVLNCVADGEAFVQLMIFTVLCDHPENVFVVLGAAALPKVKNRAGFATSFVEQQKLHSTTSFEAHDGFGGTVILADLFPSVHEYEGP